MTSSQSQRVTPVTAIAPSVSPSTTAPLQHQGGGTQYLRPHLLKLAPYAAIEPFEVLSARYGRAPSDIIKLDANENPYGPPPEVHTGPFELAVSIHRDSIASLW